jgi:hypothetical protein
MDDDVFDTSDAAQDDEATQVLPMRPAADLGVRVLRCAQLVHRALGPGLEDFLYERAMALELTAERIGYQRDALVEVRYRGAIVGKRKVSFLCDGVAVDAVAGPVGDPERLRRRAAALLWHQPVGLALCFSGGLLQASRADERAHRRVNG